MKTLKSIEPFQSCKLLNIKSSLQPVFWVCVRKILDKCAAHIGFGSINENIHVSAKNCLFIPNSRV